MGRPMRVHRLLVEAAIWRYRTGSPWRDLPPEFGPWQTAWKRHARFPADGVWDEVLTVLLSEADAAGQLDWQVSVDSTITRAHQHGTNTTREVVTNADRSAGGAPNDTNLLAEPRDHGIGRSRGGLTSTLHPLVDGRGRRWCWW